MFDFGWAEILIIGAIALFVIGPQDIPKIAYQIGKFVRRIRYMQYAITGQFDDFMDRIENQDKDKKPEEPKEELDHDPMDEEGADEALLHMMPLPDDSRKLSSLDLIGVSGENETNPLIKPKDDGNKS